MNHVQYLVQLMNEKLYLFIYYYCDTAAHYYFLQATKSKIYLKYCLKNNQSIIKK